MPDATTFPSGIQLTQLDPEFRDNPHPLRVQLE